MSKKDQLGRGSSFGGSRRSARRDAIEDTIHGGSGGVTTITDLPVPVISENPDNPRNHLRALDETVESVRELGVILPIVVATVEAYLHDRPDRATDLDDGAQYVVVDGHRRLEASRRVGLAVIPVRVDNARVATDESLLEAAFVANYHRDDMTDLEEAHALKQLVEYYGSQTKAAKRLGIPQATISSKLSLLKLTPELQRDLMAGERKVEHVRNLGKLEPAEQVARADERAESSRRQAEERPTPVVPAAEPVRESGPADYHGVIIPDRPAAPATSPAAPPPSAVGDQDATVRQDSVPEPRPAGPPPISPGGERKPVMFPYDDGAFAARLLIERMPAEEFDKMADGVLAHRARQRADAT
ncbi:ParB/RepB/Spo0J family partition protein [Streptomyces chartreusis]|uniref:ParB/RepB/Spo0J family partition protein n=1 Tax=Streptomyces chartreusis TaxID=1969 RepID=UPI00371C4DBF